MFERASEVMPGGVPSQFQAGDPWPVYVERGKGARVWDVDGNEYLDFHNGFGVMCVGHANPVIAAAVKAQMDLGTHFAAPDRGLDHRRRGAAPPLGPPPLALHQLRHRVDDGRDPPRARRHRRGRDRQDRGHLPRPPRRRDGLGQAARRADGRPRAPRLGRPTASATPRRWRSSRASSRSTTRTRSSACSTSSTAGRRRDHGAGDDEREHRPARGRLPRARARAHAARTASR